MGAEMDQSSRSEATNRMVNAILAAGGPTISQSGCGELIGYLWHKYRYLLADAKPLSQQDIELIANYAAKLSANPKLSLRQGRHHEGLAKLITDFLRAELQDPGSPLRASHPPRQSAGLPTLPNTMSW